MYAEQVYLIQQRKARSHSNDINTNNNIINSSYGNIGHGGYDDSNPYSFMDSPNNNNNNSNNSNNVRGSDNRYSTRPTEGKLHIDTIHRDAYGHTITSNGSSLDSTKNSTFQSKSQKNTRNFNISHPYYRKLRSIWTG